MHATAPFPVGSRWVIPAGEAVGAEFPLRASEFHPKQRFLTSAETVTLLPGSAGGSRPGGVTAAWGTFRGPSPSSVGSDLTNPAPTALL